jgi:hypothetical protein
MGSSAFTGYIVQKSLRHSTQHFECLDAPLSLPNIWQFTIRPTVVYVPLLQALNPSKSDGNSRTRGHTLFPASRMLSLAMTPMDLSIRPITICERAGGEPSNESCGNGRNLFSVDCS